MAEYVLVTPMSGTAAIIAADLLVAAHVAFILFVVFGGLTVLRWPRLAWLHLPAAVWGAVVELAGWICPLTPLENQLRVAGGGAAYSGDFVERYLLPIIYPSGLTREIQVALGVAVIFFNVLVYWIAIRQRAARRGARGQAQPPSR